VFYYYSFVRLFLVTLFFFGLLDESVSGGRNFS